MFTVEILEQDWRNGNLVWNTVTCLAERKNGIGMEFFVKRNNFTGWIWKDSGHYRNRKEL